MELKTLKDLGFIDIDVHKEESTESVHKEELRKEAIKWIKELRTNFLGTQDNPREPIESITRIEISNWIAKFFNITEEDLQ